MGRNWLLLLLCFLSASLPAAATPDPILTAVGDQISFLLVQPGQGVQSHLSIVSSPGRSVTFYYYKDVSRQILPTGNGLLRIKPLMSHALPSTIKVGDRVINVNALPIGSFPIPSAWPTDFKTSTGEVVLMGYSKPATVEYLAKFSKTVTTNSCGLAKFFLVGVNVAASLPANMPQYPVDYSCSSVDGASTLFFPDPYGSFRSDVTGSSQLKSGKTLFLFNPYPAYSKPIQIEYLELVTRTITPTSSKLLRIRPVVAHKMPDVVTVNGRSVNLATLPFKAMPTAKNPATTDFQTNEGEAVLIGYTSPATIQYLGKFNKTLTPNNCGFVKLGNDSKPAPTVFASTAMGSQYSLPLPDSASVQPVREITASPNCRAQSIPPYQDSSGTTWTATSVPYFPLSAIPRFAGKRVPDSSTDGFPNY